MTIRKRFGIAAILLITSACAVLGIRYLMQPSMLTFLTPEAREIVAHPEGVQVCQITTNQDIDGKLRHFRPARQDSEPRTLTAIQMAQLARALGKHGVDQEKAACSPNPGIEFLFKKGGRFVRLDLCFHCASAEFMDSEGNDLGWSNFRQVRPQLIDLCKELFPDNPVVQRLSEDLGEDLEQVGIVRT